MEPFVLESMSMRRRRIALDWDGVIHSYTTKWAGADIIPDPPVDGMLEWLADNYRRYELIIFSTRNHQEGAIDAMTDWMYRNFRELCYPADEVMRIISSIEFHKGEGKPICEIFVDDRAYQFNGTMPSESYIAEFKPWNKRKDNVNKQE